MDIYYTVVQWCLVVSSFLKDVKSSCNVDHCDLEYCSGDGCIKCNDGYYQSGMYCYQCPASCEKCTSLTSCTECKNGWHGTTCESECRIECLTCERFSQCTTCIPGRYGSFCQFHCHLGCIDILCDKSEGKCTEGCRHGFYQSREDCFQCPEHCIKCSDDKSCTECAAGYFGPYCQNRCPQSCKNQVCDKLLGHCSNGCIEGYYPDRNTCLDCPLTCVGCVDMNTCTGCKTGYWGLQCENECLLDCIRCDARGQCISDPVCNINNCDRGYCSGDGCVKCEDGYYITETSCSDCPSYCTKCSGPYDCTECVHGRYGTTCENTCRITCIGCSDFSECIGCIPGRYGSYCQFYCPLGCIDILCSKDTGRCIKGCRHGYYQNAEDCVHCPEHCVRCSDDSHCTDCASGYYGSYCEKTCPVSCINQLCHKELGYCTDGCTEGYYSDAASCYVCPIRCRNCVDGQTCTECKTGYWGAVCQFDCPVKCTKCTKDGECIHDSDCSIQDCDTEYCIENSCIKCDLGYYLSGMSCYQCPNHCIECISGNTCTRCVRGRYGTQCENTCRDTCLECVSASDCTECIHGRYGQYCQLYCPLGCIDILCDKDSGKCSRGCRPGYYISGEDCSRCPDHCTRCSDSEYCTICDSGYYGTDCQSACPLTCQNQVCDKERGICTEGCKEGYFFNDTVCISCPQKCTGCTNQNSCTECKTGYWGDLCQQECPTSCLRCEGEGQCIIGTHCDISNCDRGFCSGRSCIKCEDGYYLSGTHCYECPSRCTKCTRPTTCTECVSGRYGLECEYTCNTVCTECTSASQCTECIPGRHGPFCQFYCPLGCIDILCEKESGKCTKGCRHGYYSSETGCTQCPEHCTRCTDSSLCIACVSGYYGSVCQTTCHPSCIDRVCDKHFGNCTHGCVEGYYYDNNICWKCPEGCKSCIDSVGCSECQAGRWGRRCQYDCPIECSMCTDQGICIDDDGEECDIDNCEKTFCLENGCIKCEAGYYLSGTHCYRCKEYCTQCSGPSACTKCVRGRYGAQCEYTCNILCPDCISSSQCTECIPGRHGSTCQIYCPLGCKNILCTQDTGFCIDGCRDGYYPQEANCIACPERCTSCSDINHCSACYPGYYGSYCQMTCLQGCKEQVCHKQTGYCTEGCIKGYYFNDYCLRCPDGCSSCVDENNCVDCKAGYWGTQCQHHCPDKCYRCTDEGQCTDEPRPPCYIDNCDVEYCYGSGCTKCEDGYYLYGTNCYQCLSSCVECSSASLCTKCKQGKYGTTCENTCESTCADCISADQCTECIPGRHGSLCQLYCPLGCKDIMCEQTSGMCTEGCRNGYYPSGINCNQCPDQCTYCSNGTYCTACSPGLFGRICNMSCPVGCMDNLCDVATGNCTNGCSSGYHHHRGYCVKDEANTECKARHCSSENCFGNICVMCEMGYYLEDFQCYQCLENCTSCSSGNQCDECLPGRYGSVCQFSCPSGCKDTACSKESGLCTEGCMVGYSMAAGHCQTCPRNCMACTTLDVCTMCKIGYWGTACTYSCLDCNGTGCLQDINCTRGCQDDYYVHMLEDDQYECVQCPEGCEKCADSFTCSICKPGYWGRTCSSMCSSNCQDNSCTKVEGHCDKGCKNGFYGDSCSTRCSTRCEACYSRDNCKTCVVGRYGVMCEQICSANCFRYICMRPNGTCLYGCSIGYSGDTCENATGETYCRTESVSDIGAPLGLGVVFVLAGITICVLVFILYKGRHFREPENERTPAIMNQTYDTRIGTADFYDHEKRTSGSYDNSEMDVPNFDDGPGDVCQTVCRNPSPSNDGFNRSYNEETEYSVIRTSNDNIACF